MNKKTIALAPMPPDVLPGREVARPRAPLLEYPFQLRPNCFVSLRLPVSLTRADLGRLTAFLESLIAED
jgi:hypothetical protein